jgi:hypothetical protein
MNGVLLCLVPIDYNQNAGKFFSLVYKEVKYCFELDSWDKLQSELKHRGHVWKNLCLVDENTWITSVWPRSCPWWSTLSISNEINSVLTQ